MPPVLSRMRSALTCPAALLVSLVLSSCNLPVGKKPDPRDLRMLTLKRPAMAAPVVLDVVPLPDDKEPTMWDIAQTFPAYDWSINAFHRDGLTEEDEKRFLLKGDRSQMPVEIKQVADKSPMRVEMTIGPIHDGHGFRMPKLHYTFKRVDGGWRRLGWNVTYHGPARADGTEEPPLGEEENRARIVERTGQPFVDELDVVEELQAQTKTKIAER